MSWAVIFIVGTMLGSFFNVCIRRLPRGDSVLAPASFCFRCKRPVSPEHNLPILSYFILRGKCSFCGAAFSAQYPLVEFLAPLLFLVLHWRYGLGAEFYTYALLTSFLVVIAFIDINHMLILNRLSYPLGALGLAYASWRAVVVLRGGGGWFRALENPLGFVIGGGLLLLLYLGWRKVRGEEGLGLGDVKLAAAVGPWLGARMVFEALFLSFLLGSLWGVGLIVLRRKKLRDQLPFGAFIALAVYLRILLGPACRLVL